MICQCVPPQRGTRVPEERREVIIANENQLPVFVLIFVY